MKSQMSAVALLVVLFLLIIPTIFSAVPVLLNHSGRLLDASDTPVNETVNFTFKLYKTQFTPAVEWQEDNFGTLVNQGIYHVTLGDLTPFPDGLFQNAELWLGIQVNTDPEMMPRVRIVSVPYALNASRVSGDIQTEIAELLIEGKPSYPPELTIKDDPDVTPLIDEHLRLNDMLCAIVVDRGAGDKDSTTLGADGLRIYDFAGQETITFTPGAVTFQGVPVDFDGTEAQFLSSQYRTTIAPERIIMQSPPVPTPLLPPPAPPYEIIVLADDVLNQMFASVSTAGKLRHEFRSTSPMLTLLSSCEIDDHSVTFRSNNDTDLKCRLYDGGLKVYDGPTTPVDIGNGGAGGSGGYMELSGGSGGGRVQLTSGGIGDLRGRGGAIFIEPSGGGAGGRVTITTELVKIHDELDIKTVTLDRTSGMTLVNQSSGTNAVYSSSGVQLTGPDARRFAANPTSISLTRPSSNAALVCTIDDPSGVFRCDVDDDGLADVVMSSVPSKRLYVASGCELRCDGTANFSDISTAGMVTIGSSCGVVGTLSCQSSSTYEGTMTCRSAWRCDVNDDATVDVSCDVTPTPEFSIAPGTSFACDGMATFDLPVQMNSNLTVNGALVVLGPKAFAQEHPEDATKEIIYVALEGNEAGTYTRGSAQLKNGVAKIELPEDFHLVTNEEGLTAQITPRGPVNSMLYVDSVTATMLVVKSSNKNDGNVKFDFMVSGVRKGFENHQVIRDKKSLAMSE